MQQRMLPARLLMVAAVLLIGVNLPAQQEPNYTIRVNSDLVQISVVAHDQHGRPVRNLTKDDFVVVEDGRRQQLSAVDFETVATPNTPHSPVLPLQLPLLTSTSPVAPSAARGLRLVLLLFDFTSMEPADAARSLRAAEAYVRKIGPADRVAVVSLAARLEVQQDFTGNRTALQEAVQRLHGLSRIVLEANRRGGASDDLASATSIDDWRLRSLRALSNTLAQVPQKKSIVIFAGDTSPAPDLGGIPATIDAALRADVSYYGVDAGGLSATPPLGDAATASSFGVGLLSGMAVAQSGAAIHDQDLLYALARGTGGRAFFDSNDFARAFRTLEDDTREYYVLSYRSSNSAPDRRYRHVSVHLRRPGLRLNYQAGYYRPREAR